MNKNQTLPPAQLFIGNHEQTIAATEQLLQKIFCQNSGCNTCITCMQIREKQHHTIMWLHPEKNYTLEHFEDLFNTLSFQLNPDEHFFFIIQKADFLTAVCANKLLKPMEEPPTGYHFILLAQHSEQILPTIKSRCIIHTVNHDRELSSISHLLGKVFIEKPLPMYEFSKILDSVSINERESIELLEHILNYWLKTYQITKNENFLPVIEQLQRALLQPPMPGSATIFWRNLYLQTCNYLTSRKSTKK